uniref:Uncharacterized protein n=1 Tax=Anguilla anguilla TaxID=7936 RepID=A0A0E9S4L0_ANGAN
MHVCVGHLQVLLAVEHNRS